MSCLLPFLDPLGILDVEVQHGDGMTNNALLVDGIRHPRTDRNANIMGRGTRVSMILFTLYLRRLFESLDLDFDILLRPGDDVA